MTTNFVSKHLDTAKKKMLALVMAALLAVAAFFGIDAADFGGNGGQGTAVSAPPPAELAPNFELSADEVATAQSELDALEVRPEKASMEGYSGNREKLFGSPWTDSAVDVALAGNGCDTRNDILQRDLVPESIELDSDDCTVLSGRLWEPMNGEWVDFERGRATSSKVQIDHLVALGNVWASGGKDMTQEDRVRIANDPINLLAIDGPTNGQKGDGNAADWMPANEPIHCFYAASLIRVKAKYELFIVPEEKEALQTAIDQCPGV